MVSLESKSSEKEVDGILVCIGLPNDISNHVWCINHGDREEHVSRQGENDYLMLTESVGKVSTVPSRPVLYRG